MGLIPSAPVLVTGLVDAMHPGTNAKLDETLMRPWRAWLGTAIAAVPVISTGRLAGRPGGGASNRLTVPAHVPRHR